MAVPPTSPIRVFPQPVAVDVKGFMPQTNLFKEGMDAFQTGAKLPLLMEQIKHEKKRIKMDTAKLDFAASAVGRAQQKEADQMARDLAAANVDKAKAEAAEARSRAAGMEIVDLGPVSLAGAASGGGLSPTTPLADEGVAVTEPAPSVLEGEGLGENFVGRLFAPPPAAEGEAAEGEAAEVSHVYVPEFGTKNPVDDIQVIALPGPIGSRDASGYASQRVQEQLNIEFPPYRGARKDEPAYEQAKRKRRMELVEQFKPTESKLSIKDKRGVPLSLKVLKVGDEVADILSMPTLDLDGRTTDQIKRDAKYQESLTEPEYVSNRVTRDSNIERLINASEYLITAKDGWNPFDSRVAGLLPESVRLLFNSDREKARNEARTVIQQQLRATLGAQFAFREGEQMLDRSFKLLFDDATNLQMLRSAAQNILTVSREFERAEDYFNNNQTLTGFQFNKGLVKEHPVLSNFDTAITAVSSDATKKAPTTTAIPEASQTYRSKRRKRDE